MPSRTSSRGLESGRTWYGGDSPHLPLTLGGGTGKAGENGQRSQRGQRKTTVAETVGWVPPRAGGFCTPKARGLEACSLSTGSPAGHTIGVVVYSYFFDTPLCGSMYSQATVSQGSPPPLGDWLASGAGVIRGTEKETLGSTGGSHHFVGDSGQLSSCLSARAFSTPWEVAVMKEGRLSCRGGLQPAGPPAQGEVAQSG